MTIGILIAYILFMQKYGYFPQKIDGAYFCIYEGLDLGERWGKRLRFGVSLADHSLQSYALKFEERNFGKFVVGVYSKEKNSIQYNTNVHFSLNDPLERLVEEFPDNCYIKNFVDCLSSSKLQVDQETMARDGRDP